jgi:hypothetical protein
MSGTKFRTQRTNSCTACYAHRRCRQHTHILSKNCLNELSSKNAKKGTSRHSTRMGISRGQALYFSTQGSCCPSATRSSY